MTSRSAGRDSGYELDRLRAYDLFRCQYAASDEAIASFMHA